MNPGKRHKEIQHGGEGSKRGGGIGTQKQYDRDQMKEGGQNGGGEIIVYNKGGRA